MSAERPKISLHDLTMSQTSDVDKWRLGVVIVGEQNTLFGMIEEIRSLLKDIDAATKE